MKYSKFILAVALTALVTTASAAGKSDVAKAAKPGNSSIVEIAVNDGRFDILTAAVVTAGLDGALSGAGQYTVFAPTDEAFIDLLSGDGPRLTEEEAIALVESLGADALTPILLYHVVEGRRTSTSILAAPEYETLAGEYLSRDELATAGIEQINISASNGIIHVIGAVLLP